MSYHIHICSIGEKPELPLAICRAGLDVDEIILLNSNDVKKYNKVEDEVIRKLNEVNIFDIVQETIDPFDFQNVSNTVLKICEREMELHKDCRFHFNFTAGTNIVAGAICFAAQLIPNSDFYYLKEKVYCRPPSDKDVIIKIQYTNSEEFKLLENKKELAKVFELFDSMERMSNDELVRRSGKSPSNISYHTSTLLQKGFIHRDKENIKPTVWVLTEKGRKVLDDYKLKIRISNIGN